VKTISNLIHANIGNHTSFWKTVRKPFNTYQNTSN